MCVHTVRLERRYWQTLFGAVVANLLFMREIKNSLNHLTINTTKQMFYLSSCEAIQVRAVTASGSAAAGGTIYLNGIESALRRGLLEMVLTGWPTNV